MGDDLAALLRPPHPPSLVGDLGTRMRAIAGMRPTAALRAEIALALACKWWGVRVEAIRVLGCWGGDDDKAWLVARASRTREPSRMRLKARRGDPCRWRDLETCEARRALLPLLAAADACWVLDLWFTEYRALSILQGSMLMRLPNAPVEARVWHELRHGDPADLEALAWLIQNRTSLPARTEILAAIAARTGTAGARTAQRLLRINARR